MVAFIIAEFIILPDSGAGVDVWSMGSKQGCDLMLR